MSRVEVSEDVTIDTKCLFGQTRLEHSQSLTRRRKVDATANAKKQIDAIHKFKD